MAEAGGPSNWDRDHLLDLFSSFGPVTLKRMFSGFGISVDGVNFAMALRAGIIFRVDEGNAAKYDAEGAAAFQYTTSKKKVVVQSYRHIPERLYDDEDEFALWAREALDAARRAKAGQKRGRSARAIAGKTAAAKTSKRPLKKQTPTKARIESRTKVRPKPRKAGRTGRQAT